MENLIELLKTDKELRKQARQLIATAVGEMAEKRTDVNFNEWFDKTVGWQNVDADENTLPTQRVSNCNATLDRCECEEPEEEPIKICLNCNGYIE